MKPFYSRFRVMLLTFTFGLAVVPFSNLLFEKWSEIPVDLPEVESDSPIIVMVPNERRPFSDWGGSSPCGRSTADFDVSREKKAKDNPKKKKLKSRPVINKNRD